MKALQQQNTYIADREDLKDELVGQWLKLKQGRTRLEYERNINRFFDYLRDHKIDSVRPHVVSDYKNDLLARGLKPASVNTYLAPVKDFFDWAYEMDYLHFNAGKYIKFIKKAAQHSNKARALSADEVKALLSEANKANTRHYLALSMLFYLGLRVSELTGIRISDINFNESTIVINGKGNKTRELGINKYIMHTIQNYLRLRDLPLRSNDYLIQSSNKDYNKKPMATYSISKMINKYAKAAGIDTDGISTHSGRVTAINFLLDNEVSMRDVANFAGHSDINTTRGYDRKQSEKIIQTSKIIDFS